MRYRSRIPNPALVAPINRVVQPGEEFDSDLGLFHPELEPLDEEAKAHVAAVEAENAAHAAEYAAQTSGQGAAAAGPLPDHRAALGLPPLPPAPEPTDEEKRIRGLAPLPDTAAPDPGSSRQHDAEIVAEATKATKAPKE